MLKRIRDKLIFRSNNYFDLIFLQLYRRINYYLRGTKINLSTRIPKLTINWPHQLSIGENCTLEDHLIFKYDSIWKKGPNIIIGNNVFIGNNTEFNISKNIIIGNDCLIASNCKFIDHNHGFSDLNSPIRLQELAVNSIVINGNVWIGTNCVILKGVSIGTGSIIGAGSVVNKNIPPNEIWAGIPAKFIKKDSNLMIQNLNYENKKIFVLRNNDLGDVLVTTPLIAGLRIAFPNCHIAIGV